jgi:YHS domain-containing protein
MRLIAAALALLVALAAPALAGSPPVYSKDGKVAINGYDPVSYFDGTPMPGKPGFTAMHQGAEWHFASAENRDKFLADPAKFAPQYGGYCAYGVAQGYAVKTEPDVWTIVDGKLYLNYDKDVQSTWEKDIPGYIATADGKWPKVLE